MTQLMLGEEPATETGDYAVISPCERYRYELGRVVDPSNPRTLLWSGVNPSTADAKDDDHTVTKIRRFTQLFGFGRFIIINPYAYRTAYPKALREADRAGIDIVGPENGDRIRRLSREHDHCIVAWGDNFKDRTHQQTMLGWLQYGPLQLWTLGLTKSGNPRHPLMLAYSTQRQRWGTHREQS